MATAHINGPQEEAALRRVMDAIEQRDVLTGRVAELERVLKQETANPNVAPEQLAELQDDVEGLRIAKVGLKFITKQSPDDDQLAYWFGPGMIRRAAGGTRYRSSSNLNW